jgi:hypothetical protein
MPGTNLGAFELADEVELIRPILPLIETPLTVTTLTWVQSHMSCAHRDRLTDALHGHTWRVRTYYAVEPDAPRDAVVLLTKLQGVLAVWDHTELPPTLQSAEQIAAAVKHLVGCTRVDCWRDLEGMGATVE